MSDWLDGEEFYEWCQAYRWAGDVIPRAEGMPTAAEAFEALKEYIRSQLPRPEEGLTRDAARYRWLRSISHLVYDAPIRLDIDGAYFEEDPEDSDIDAAIDEAMERGSSTMNRD